MFNFKIKLKHIYMVEYEQNSVISMYTYLKVYSLLELWREFLGVENYVEKMNSKYIFKFL